MNSLAGEHLPPLLEAHPASGRCRCGSAGAGSGRPAGTGRRRRSRRRPGARAQEQLGERAYAPHAAFAAVVTRPPVQLSRSVVSGSKRWTCSGSALSRTISARGGGCTLGGLADDHVGAAEVADDVALVAQPLHGPDGGADAWPSRRRSWPGARARPRRRSDGRRCHRAVPSARFRTRRPRGMRPLAQQAAKVAPSAPRRVAVDGVHRRAADEAGHEEVVGPVVDGLGGPDLLERDPRR